MAGVRSELARADGGVGRRGRARGGGGGGGGRPGPVSPGPPRRRGRGGGGGGGVCVVRVVPAGARGGARGAGVAISAASALAAGRFGARHGVVALGVMYGVVHFIGQAKGWEYHLYPLAAFAIVLLFAEVRPALARVRWPPALPLLLCVLVTAALLTAKAGDVSDAGWERDRAERARRLADELAARLAPGDTVQVLDTTGGGIHALLRLHVKQPTRFIYDFHFFHDAGH